MQMAIQPQKECGQMGAGHWLLLYKGLLPLLPHHLEGPQAFPKRSKPRVGEV